MGGSAGTARARAKALLALTERWRSWCGSCDWVAFDVMILSLGYLWEAGVMLMWSTLRSRADLDHVAVGQPAFARGSGVLAARDREPPDAWTLDMIASLVAKVAFLLLGVAALQLGVELLLDRWPLVGVPLLLFGVAALLGGVAPCWTDGF